MPIPAIIPALAKAAGSVAGGALSMGGKGGGNGQSQALINEQVANARLSRELGLEQANRTRPLLNRTAATLKDFLKTGQTPSFIDLPATVEPLAALSLPGLAAQQGQIRNAMVSQGIRGGQLQQSLANLAIQGGLQRTGLLQQDLLRQEGRDVERAGLRQRLFGAASDFGTGGVSQAFQGLGGASTGFAQAGQLYNQQAALQQQRDIMASQGTGQLLGKGLSLLGGYALPGFPSGSLGASKS